MSDGDNKDGPPPKSRGEQLAEKLAGSNPVEPKPASLDQSEPPAGPADVMSTKAADAKAAESPQSDATSAPPEGKAAGDKAADETEKAAAEMAAAAKRVVDKAAAEKKAVADKAAAEKKVADDKKAAEKAAAEKARLDALPPPPPPWYKTLRADPPFYIRIALGAGMVALILTLWWFLTRGAAHEAIISPNKLVSPGATFGSTDTLLERDLLDNTLETLQRVFLGVGLAALVGVTLGVFAGAHRGISAALSPVVIFLRSVPMGAMLPLTLLMFGTEEKQKVMFLFLAVVPFVFSDTMKGIASVPDRYLETAQTLGASKGQIIRKVLVPLALPDIVTSLRFQFGLALGYVMLAEAGQVFVERGLGRMIEVSQRQGPREHVFLLLFVIAAMGFVIDLLMRSLQRGVFAWRKDL